MSKVCDQEEVNTMKKSKQWLGVRHLQVLMMFLGQTTSSTGRATISIAIVAMTDPKNENFFDWTIQRQSVILSSFAWGYVLLQGASGELAAKFGGMNLMIASVGVNSIVSLLLPVAAIYGGWVVVCGCRLIQGLLQGLMYPALQYLIGKWVPLNERSQMASFIFSGAQFGTGAQMVVSGYIAEYWGWPAIFYVNGVVGLFWAVAYLLVGSDNPQKSKLISDEERFHIQSSLGQIGGHKRLKTPWKAILTSKPFIATVITNVGFTWGYWTLLTEIPTYMSKVLNVDIKSNGVMSALPYLIMFIMNFPVGYVSDFILKNGWVNVTVCRKIFNSIGFFGPAIFLLCLSYAPANKVALAFILLCVTFAFKAGFYGGFMVVFLDLAQNFSSSLVAFSNTMANAVALFAPLFAGFTLHDETNPKEWRVIFYVCAVFYVVANIIFLIFATSKTQTWNEGVEIPKKSVNV